MEIIILACWGIWTVLNNMVFEHIDPSLDSWKIKFKLEFVMVIQRANKKHFPLVQDWLDNLFYYPSWSATLFDGIEEGGISASAYSSREIHEQENDQAMDNLHDRVSVLKRLTGDINEKVENHNRMLDRMGNDMDASRGFLSGTVDKSKMVFEAKSSRRMATMVAPFIAVFLLIWYLTK